MKKNIRVVAAVLVGVIITGGFAFVQSRARAAGETDSGPSYATAIARRARVELYVKGSASISANEKRTIKSAVPGTIEIVHVADGQPVQAGQTLVSIKNDKLLHELEQAKVDLETRLVQIEASTSPSEGDRASAESQLKFAVAMLRDRTRDMEKLSILSPINGRITNVTVNPGDAVAPGQLLVTVVDDTEVLVQVQVLQSEISKIKIGQNCSVAFGTDLPTANGTVHSIGAQAEIAGRNTIVPVSIRVDNKSGSYRSGLGANATITITDDETVSASGTVFPRTKYDMRAEVSGHVQVARVIEGDSATSGQELLRLVNASLEAAVDQAKATVKVAEENLARVQSGRALTVSESDLKTESLKYRQAQIALASKMSEVEYLQVKSPISGIMVSHSVSSGDEITASQALCNVADYSTMTMVIPVDELDVSNISLGQKATVTVEAVPGRVYDAEVTKIATEGVKKDGVANYDVTLTLTETTSLRGSMSANASILAKVKDDALVVPAEAVRTSKGVKTVVLLRNDVQETVEVKTGLSNGTITEVISGVEEGDVVVVTALDRKRINPFLGQ